MSSIVGSDGRSNGHNIGGRAAAWKRHSQRDAFPRSGIPGIPDHQEFAARHASLLDCHADFKR
jgi:hypothetical protein